MQQKLSEDITTHSTAAGYFAEAAGCFPKRARAQAELTRVPADTEDFDLLLRAAAQGGHPMQRDLTSGIIPLRPLAGFKESAATWQTLSGSSRIHVSPDGELIAKEGRLTELAAQAGALARLNFRFKVCVPRLCLIADDEELSEDDCYRYNLGEEDGLLGVGKVPEALLLMDKVSLQPLAEFVGVAGNHELLKLGLAELEREMQSFLIGLGYAPDQFRLGPDLSKVNIALKHGALDRALKQGRFQIEDVVCLDPVIGYADLTGFGKSIAELFPFALAGGNRAKQPRVP